MPPHRVYIEPFLGGGAVFRLKRPAEINIGIDLDSEVTRRWILPSKLTPAADAAEFGDSAGGVAGTGGARRRWSPEVAARASESGGAARDDLVGSLGLAARARAGESGGGAWDDLVGSLGLAARSRAGESGGVARDDLGVSLDMAAKACAARSGGGDVTDAESGDVRSPRWQVSQGDALAFLRSYRFQGDELVYCDPPYLMETRSSGCLYACEMSDGGHRKLLKILKRLPCMVMISGYWSELYGSSLAGWRSLSFEACTRGGMATEWLWMNFPPAVALHDYCYLGANRRQREQLKRQKARWMARLGRMDELKRGALLSAIEEYSSSVCGNGGAAGSLGMAAMPIFDSGAGTGSTVLRCPAGGMLLAV